MKILLLSDEQFDLLIDNLSQSFNATIGMAVSEDVNYENLMLKDADETMGLLDYISYTVETVSDN